MCSKPDPIALVLDNSRVLTMLDATDVVPPLGECLRFILDKVIVSEGLENFARGSRVGADRKTEVLPREGASTTHSY